MKAGTVVQGRISLKIGQSESKITSGKLVSSKWNHIRFKCGRASIPHIIYAKSV